MDLPRMPDTALYKELDRVTGELAGAIIRGFPEYQRADWLSRETS
jgi:hypothetical protein